MNDVSYILLALSSIMFFGIFAEFLFKRTGLPDILFLLFFGIILGEFGLGIIKPSDFVIISPVFTTFTLLFLLYDGAFNIDLQSLSKSIKKSIGVTFYFFLVSCFLVTGFMTLIGYPILTSLLVGFTLGGISSAFVVPIVKQLKVSSETYSVLTLESAFTDVLCIVSAIAVAKLITLETLEFQFALSQIVSLFAVGAFVGTLFAWGWIVIVVKFFNKNKPYMLTIACLMLTYFFADYFGGNGAIASLSFGLVLRNSSSLSEIVYRISTNNFDRPLTEKGISITTAEEEFFYNQLSFILKTFFFVYVGSLINFSEVRFLLIGIALSCILFLARKTGFLIMPKDILDFDSKIIRAVFARGLAAAAIAQILILDNIPFASDIASIVYVVILGTIILSSFEIFFILRRSNVIKQAVLS
ncbi:MAG: cation:proton antiporter [Candidatus Diapherotrites archaeon]